MAKVVKRQKKKASEQAEKQKERDKSLHLVILNQMVKLSTSGFGVVAALAWNNVIQDLVNNHIKPYLPQGSSLLSLIIYAVAITLLAVLTTYYLSRLIKRLEDLDNTLSSLKKVED